MTIKKKNVLLAGGLCLAFGILLGRGTSDKAFGAKDKEDKEVQTIAIMPTPEAGKTLEETAKLSASGEDEKMDDEVVELEAVKPSTSLESETAPVKTSVPFEEILDDEEPQRNRRWYNRLCDGCRWCGDFIARILPAILRLTPGRS